MGVNKEARKFARKGERLLGLVDSHSAIYVQCRGDKLVFASIEAPSNTILRGFRDLDLSSIAVGWKVLFGARYLENIDDYVDQIRCEDKQPTSPDRLGNFLGIPKRSQHTLWDHIPQRSIGRLLEVAEQLGGVKDGGQEAEIRDEVRDKGEKEASKGEKDIRGQERRRTFRERGSDWKSVLAHMANFQIKDDKKLSCNQEGDNIMGECSGHGKAPAADSNSGGEEGDWEPYDPADYGPGDTHIIGSQV
ncbi:hypothetical protein JHW43_002793 [Diplocarpon mali]|nr:hypothetical protein JHW43_002793 [Diplocarpon mali]